jgi:DNA-directed RNA polymerase I, II, and III subunit RPABC5
MIIPVRCMSCGKVTGDKWVYYQKGIAELQDVKGPDGKPLHPTQFYTDGKNLPKTAECIMLDKLGMTRWCCRTTLLTHVDTIDKH